MKELPDRTTPPDSRRSLADTFARTPWVVATHRCSRLRARSVRVPTGTSGPGELWATHWVPTRLGEIITKSQVISFWSNYVYAMYVCACADTLFQVRI